MIGKPKIPGWLKKEVSSALRRKLNFALTAIGNLSIKPLKEILRGAF